MRGVLRVIGILILALVGVAAVVGIVARYGDGPVGPWPGGPLRSGSLAAEASPDWSFARELPTIELETLASGRSRTTWVLVVGDNLYVPCGLPGIKRWPHALAQDPRVVLRLAGRRYERSAVRVTDPEVISELGAEAARKYKASGDFEVWFFRMDPRPGT